jgi:hypothetical protein
MAFTGYFDGSGHRDSTKAMVVAGFLAPTEQWLKFEREWQDCLDRFKAPPLHMRNFAHSAKEFSDWKNKEIKRRALLTSLIEVIKRNVTRSFASAVQMDDYRRVDSRFCLHEYAQPYALCGASCIARCLQWARSENIRVDQVLFVFEDGDRDRGQLRQRIEENYHFEPLFRKKEKTVAFQAADLLAYEHFNVNVRLAVLPKDQQMEFEELRHPLKALSEIPGAHGPDWGVHMEDDMTHSCIRMKIPERSAAV